MKKQITSIFTVCLLVALLLVSPYPASAATTTTETTSSVAITSTTTATVTLASATNVSAGGFLYFEDGEQMQVTGSYVSGTLIPVMRGNGGTIAKTHPSGVAVAVFAPGNQARAGLLNGPAPGSNPSGSCTAANLTVLPVFNTTFNTRFDCLNSKWVRTGAGGNVIFCGATSGTTTCTPASGISARSIGGIATLASNSAVISAISPAFTSTSTFTCVANDITTRANPVQVANTSSSSITITNTTGASDVISWICVGY